MSSSSTPTGIAYDRAGPTGAATVVLLHAGVADRRMWDPLWDGLTAARDAVRLDLRGFGESARPPAGPIDPVSDVLETLAHLGVDAGHLVGSSFGAGVAMEVALTRPALTRSVVLAPPGGSLLTERTPDLAAFAAAEGAALERGDLAAAVEANVETWVVGRGRTLDDVAPAVPAAVRVMQRRAFDIDAVWAGHDLRGTEADPPVAERCGELTVPLLLVVGGHDLDAVHRAAHRLEAEVAQVRRVDRPHAAHLPSMEEPEDFLSLLLEWVCGQD